MDILRFATAGSVDDGKSTLIGRLLYDTKTVFADQIEAVERVSKERGEDHVNLALLTDGLRAEREQGITIESLPPENSSTGRSNSAMTSRITKMLSASSASRWLTR